MPAGRLIASDGMTAIPTSSSQLVAALIASDNQLTISDPAPDARAAWRRVLYALINSDAAPRGLRVRHTGRDHGDLVIRLVPDTPANVPRPEPLPKVAVPVRLTRPHPLIAATRDAAGKRTTGWVDTRRTADALHVNVAAASVRRVLLLAQALVDEAIHRGHEVRAISGHRCPGGLGIFVNGHGSELVFTEETDRTPHQATKAELDDAARYSWIRVPEWDPIPSGRVQLKVGHTIYDPRLTGDRTRWKLEDRLALALHKIETLAAEAEQQRLDAEAREAERRRAYEAAVERARDRYREAKRAEHLHAQVDQWRRADEIRAFIAHVRATAGSHGHALDDGWLEWAARYADSLDPTQSPVVGPVVADPEPGQLQPFLDGWSPYGPERATWRA